MRLTRPRAVATIVLQMRRILASVLALLAALVVAFLRVGPGGPPHRETPPTAPTATLAPDRTPAGTPTPEDESRVDPARDAQIARVIESMDRSGRPPAGVAQGGRRHGPKGVFDNAQRLLPVRPAGYYIETDVWPRRPGGRGAERLVFGREREVFYTADHYRTFRRLR